MVMVNYIPEKPLGDWTILSASKYQIEETWIYGLIIQQQLVK
jgi:hypothetical protein